MIDVVAAYGLDVTGGTDNAAKLQTLANDIDGWYKGGKRLPELRFANGEIKFSHWPNLAYPELHLIGEGDCRLVYTGTGDAVVLDGSIIGNSHEPGIDRLQFLGFKVVPNQGRGLVITACHRSRFDVNVTGATDAVTVRFCILGEFRVFAQGSLNGVVLDCLPNGTLQTTACTFINPIIESNSSNGLWIKNAGGTTVIGGTIESNGTGLRIDSGGHNRLFGVDIESNGTDLYMGSGAHDNTFWLSNPSALKWAGSWNLTNRAV